MKGHLEEQDIQALIFGGYGDLHVTRYIFLQVGKTHADVANAKAWLKEFVEAEEVLTQRAFKKACLRHELPKQVLHIAFTAKGLKRLGLSRQEMNSFSPEFVEGMAQDYRARSLGDTGASAPTRWEFGGSGKSKEIHIVLMLLTQGDRKHLERLQAFHEEHRKRYKAHGLREVFAQDAYLKAASDQGGFVEPFGFRDGITQPCIEGTQRRHGQTQPIKAGEFILGYENAYGQLPLTPRVPAERDPHGLLPSSQGSPSFKDLGRNGTYLVLRKLRQDVGAFKHFLKAHSQDPKDPEGELLAAKMMGRWRSGAPLVLSPEKDDAKLAKDPERINAFMYKEDPRGLRCPIGAHIRRSNPRDGLIGDPKESLKVADRHLIIRRGRPYQSDDGEEGVVFIALNANIQRQFEFIQQSWVNNPKFGGHYDSRDPILGANHDPEREGSRLAEHSVTIPAEPMRHHIKGLPRFVHVRGGGYFFLPGIQALRFLAS
ncbi:peroxidase [Stigmatella sp. ncwal1]|uniref:Peroxidase n=1 Tax=Stigmatella ashevillensis TaxID=2995309 RepID=A0ABT5D9J0_9BACT|nr:peroxidase [Stigmatella ashevillena]MDC0709473.1 peroxidase [Stigmatella ashevillena]